MDSRRRETAHDRDSPASLAPWRPALALVSAGSDPSAPSSRLATEAAGARKSG